MSCTKPPNHWMEGSVATIDNGTLEKGKEYGMKEMSSFLWVTWWFIQNKRIYLWVKNIHSVQTCQDALKTHSVQTCQDALLFCVLSKHSWGFYQSRIYISISLCRVSTVEFSHRIYIMLLLVCWSCTTSTTQMNNVVSMRELERESGRFRCDHRQRDPREGEGVWNEGDV